MFGRRIQFDYKLRQFSAEINNIMPRTGIAIGHTEQSSPNRSGDYRRGAVLLNVKVGDGYDGITPYSYNRFNPKDPAHSLPLNLLDVEKIFRERIPATETPQPQAEAPRVCMLEPELREEEREPFLAE